MSSTCMSRIMITRKRPFRTMSTKDLRKMAQDNKMTEYQRIKLDIINWNNNIFSLLTCKTWSNLTYSIHSIQSNCRMFSIRIHKVTGMLMTMKCHQTEKSIKKAVITSWHSRKRSWDRALKISRQSNKKYGCKAVTKKKSGMTARVLRRWVMG